MSSRTAKEAKLKHNVEVNVERSYRQYLKEHHKTDDLKQKEYFRELFTKSAERCDKKLDHIWNEHPRNESDMSKLPELGYFGGVDFDERGKIIK